MRQRIRSTGAALLSAIFLIVVLAALGASMASLSNVEHDTATKSMRSAQVYYGAKSGLEWAIQRAIAAASCAGATFSPSGSGLEAVSVTVTCAQSTHGAGNITYYITSVATAGTAGSLSYAERHMEATVSNIP